jgi:dihydrolipoamide dehydrogenase
MREFKLPELGENITSGQVINLLVKSGDTVVKNQDLIEIETDKASLPVPSPFAGTIQEIRVKPGDTVSVGEVIMMFNQDSSTSDSSDSSPKKSPSVSTEAPPKTPPSASNAKESNAETPEASTPIRLVVIGGGPGGYTAAFHAADLGMDTTLIEIDQNPGGVCLYRGCIPSKALLHAAKVMHEAKSASAIGIEFESPKVNLDRLRDWKNKVVNQLTGGLGQLSKQRKVRYIQGRASFVNSTTINVIKTDGSSETISFDKAILATGSRPIIIPDWPNDSPRLIDSTGALNLDNIPETMLLVGGGVIGLELGTVYAELGSKLDVVEMLGHLVAGADRDIVAVLEKRLKDSFRDIMLETRVTGMTDTPEGMTVTFSDKNGTTFERTYEKVLVAIGRRPNSEDIGLENTGVTVTERGFVQVNAQQQTSDPAIYAIGDLVGQPMLAHKASHEGIVAAEAISGLKVAFEPKTIPAVVYTDPEIAWCGLTETEAKAKGVAYQVTKFPWAASGRALTMARTDGLTKLLFDPETEIIIGMSIVGPGAGELIAEGVLAVEMSATATDLKMSIHPHPTTTETIMESAEGFFGQSTHIYRPRKK